MAVTITQLASKSGAGVSQSSATTGATVTATTANNDWLVVILAAAQQIVNVDSIVDSVGNTYTQRALFDFSTRCVGVWTSEVTTNITNGTITIDYDPITGSHSQIQVYRVRPDSGNITFVAAHAGTTGSATNHAATTVSVSNGNTIFGIAGLQTDDSVTGDSDTTNGSWSTIWNLEGDGGSDSTAVTLVSQHKTATGTGNQSWTCTTTSARNSGRTYLVLHSEAAAFSLSAAQGQYTLSGTAMTPRRGKVPLAALAGSYALTGSTVDLHSSVGTKTLAADAGSYSLLGTSAAPTHGYIAAALAGSYALAGVDAPTLHGWRIAAGTDTGAPLLDELGNPLLDEFGNPLLSEGITGGSYALTGTSVNLTYSLGSRTLAADAGSYGLTGTDVTLTETTLVNRTLAADSGSYTLTGTDAAPEHGWKVTADIGSYSLTGSAAVMVTAANKALLGEPGSYALVGTDVVLTAGTAPVSVSPLHIGEWPIDKKKRRRREDAVAAEQRARKRFRDAIGRLLEGQPPEFDEPADLDEALDSAVQAGNLLYAMSAPIREINAVNELIDHIRQLRIAQPIAQLHMAQAYNQAHRHLTAKAQEDTVMALLLGE